MELIVGVGEIGFSLKQLFEKNSIDVAGIDLDSKRGFGVPKNITQLHICIPYSTSFINTIKDFYDEWAPNSWVIHSTVKPGTTKILHDRFPISNLIYSPVRGVHARMLQDLERYTKCYSGYLGTDPSQFLECFQEKCNIRVQSFSTPLALELAKIVLDTSYYGWIIAYGQLVDKICTAHNVNYDELWTFTEEIHQVLGNRPKTYVDPTGIGGHCVLQNLDLIENDLPELKQIITTINQETTKRYSRLAS
jgi:UDP-N-acetyl-D-mannosaminuronate dehydrogenase